jgi:hypothetical protein
MIAAHANRFCGLRAAQNPAYRLARHFLFCFQFVVCFRSVRGFR